jgi:hypothetical protein
MDRASEGKDQFSKLRANYDAAFQALCQAIAEFESSGGDSAAAKQRVDVARAACNRARNALAATLLDRKLEAAAKGLGRKRGKTSVIRRNDTRAILF